MAYTQLFGRDDQLVVKNPTNREFILGWDGRRYRIEAGAIKSMPGYMAEHFVKEMTNLLMQKESRSDAMMSETERTPYYQRIIISHTRMTAVGDAKDAGDIIDLPDAPQAQPAANKPEGGLRPAAKTAPKANAKDAKKKDELKDAPDDLADDAPLDLDDLPKDEDLYPDPKADKKKPGEDSDPDADAFPGA